MLTRIAIALSLLVSTTADAKPRHRKPRVENKWMRDCIHERTGLVGGVPKREARMICAAEMPEDELEAAKQQLAIARANAKVARVQERVRKALEACEQAVTDRCVETAPDDVGADCDVDAGLRAEVELVCHGRAPVTEGK